jgi:uncharacterized membrane protein (DUF4010 family)
MSGPLLSIGVSLALGLLIGMQRERTDSAIAGIRTFPLMTLFGTLCTFLSQEFGGWIVAAGLLALGALVISGSVAKHRGGDIDAGLTTEIAAVLLFAVGALVPLHLSAGVVVAGIVVLLLHLKEPLHRMVANFGERDVRAVMQFVLISLVILPILPNQEYGPFQVLNPFKIWLMVVLIVGISLCGYVAFKLVGARTGALIGGVLGGLISSTATTVSFARSSKAPEARPGVFATVIVVASTIVFARVLVLIAAAASSQFPQLAPPLFAMLGAMVVIALVSWFWSRKEKASPPEPENPAELKPALIFGALYAGVLLAVEAARHWFGQAGVYTVAVISGLTDMDAITLSMSQLAARGEVNAPTAWRAILIASLSNIAFKTILVATLGTRGLLWRVAIMFAAAAAAGGAILALWPW